MTTRSTRTRSARGLLAVACAGALIAAACGDDDSADAAVEGEPVAAAAAGEDTTEEYCELAREIAEGGPPTEEQLRLVRDLAPQEIADDVAYVVDALLERGPAAFGDSDVQAHFDPIDAFEERACGIEPRDFSLPDGVTTELDPDAQQVAVVASDYGFDFDVPSAGRVSFVMSNQGDEPHHMIIVKLADGVLEELTLDGVLSVDDDYEFELEVASDVAGPGQDAVLTFENLEPGDYVMACFIADHEGTPHAFLGMATAFTIE